MKPRKNLIFRNVLIALSIFLFLLLGQHFNILGGVLAELQNLSNPLKEKIYTSFGSQKLTQETIDSQSILRKLAQLESENASLKKENESMKRLLGSPLPPSWHFLSSKVIGQVTGDYLQIDKGQDEKVTKGRAVIFENTYVGQIDFSGPHFSKVLLPSSSNAKVLAISKDDNGASKAKGILLGKDNRIYFEKVLMKEKLEIGDLILTAGDENLPPDIPIGRIEKVIRNEDEVYQAAQIKMLTDPKTLDVVFIVTER